MDGSSDLRVSKVAAARMEDRGLASGASDSQGGWIQPNGHIRYPSSEQGGYSEEQHQKDDNGLVGSNLFK
ncbi:hypothetical protein E2562_016543 [Oryza meyeriana var. granulata]|uniref:Uncharacterized protein n=1 Tax=Oryza meyeriana var. granulata TaxID=110450 RepID=A0A6G1C6K9_9ORYZ|nr:hypothetical protein E2562_016543 [Oryza meyeriana var. granulata]